MRLVKNMAERAGWDILPMKHSGRISCATTLAMVQIPPDRIDLHMGWRSQTMQKYYIRDFILTEPQGPAAKLAQFIRQHQLNSCQTHMCNNLGQPLTYVKGFAEKR